MSQHQTGVIVDTIQMTCSPSVLRRLKQAGLYQATIVNLSHGQ